MPLVRTGARTTAAGLRLDAHDVRLAAQEAKLDALLAMFGPAFGAIATSANALAALASKLQSGVGTMPLPGETQPAPLPADANAYPIETPASASRGDPVTLGTGPDYITLDVANHPVNNPTGEFDVLVGAAVFRLKVTKVSTAPPGQRFTLRGVFGSRPDILLANFNYAGAMIFSVSANSYPYAYTGPRPDDAGFADQFTTVMNFAQMPLTFKPFVVRAPVTPTPIDTGSGGTNTLAELVAKAQALGTITLPAGTIIGTTLVDKPMTITGAGQGQTVIDAQGLDLAAGKGVFVPTVPGVVISNMTIKGAVAPDNAHNGAAVRDASAGPGFTLDNVEITACEDGLLTFSGNYTVRNSHIHHNGTGDGRSHNAYFNGNPSSIVTLENNRIEDASGGHGVKSRAGTTIAMGNTVRNEDGCCYDIPECGRFEATDEVWTKPLGSPDFKLFAYGVETDANAATGMEAKLTNITIDNPSGSEFFHMRVGATLRLDNVTYTGPKPPAVVWCEFVKDAAGKTISSKIVPEQPGWRIGDFAKAAQGAHQ